MRTKDEIVYLLNDPVIGRREKVRNLNNSMFQLDSKELDDPFGDKKGERKMEKRDQKDLLIFVNGILEDVIESIDVNDRNGKEVYSLATQTKEEIEEGMNTMEEFGNAYEELHRKTYKEHKVREESSKLLELMLDTYKKKNADYGDSFAESVAWFGYEAAYVRIYDKIMRYISLATKDPQVVSESKADTLLDLANYCVMFYGILLNSDYESTLRYIIMEFNENALNIDDTICYSTSNKPVIVTPSHYYIPVDKWKESVEYWSDDIPELKDEVFKLAVSAIRIIVLSEVEKNERK